ncbi:MAG: hypothetical protein IKA03_04080 [Alphaproteobacteria bacterium]|nr:hypothetical protein [Alphaproteobacteria bacterium]
MDEVSKLIQQAKPLYFARKRKRRILSSIIAVSCCCFLVLITSFKQDNFIYDSWMEEVYNTANGSIIEDMGLPVDEYGLLWIG